MSEPQKPESMRELMESLPRRVFQRDALLLLVAAIVGGGVVVGAQQQRKEASEEDLAPLTRRIQVLEDGGRRHQEDSAEVHLELKRDMAELARDVRELYRVVRDPSRRSERLEQPVAPDGGR